MAPSWTYILSGSITTVLQSYVLWVLAMVAYIEVTLLNMGPVDTDRQPSIASPFGPECLEICVPRANGPKP